MSLSSRRRRERARETGLIAGTGGAMRLFLYGFFAVHMLGFGLSGFLLAYVSRTPDLKFLYLHGGIAITVYLMFYLVLFGMDQVRWMLINAGLGILGLCAQVSWILGRFGRGLGDYPWYVHVVPFTYYVLYMFLLRQALLDLTGARTRPERRRWVEACYVAVSVAISLLFLWRQAAGRG